MNRRIFLIIGIFGLIWISGCLTTSSEIRSSSSPPPYWLKKVSTILHTPNPPSELTVLDQAQAYFHKNGNIRLTVHLLKLFHLAPRSDKPLLVINHQVEKVTILKFEKISFS